MVLSFLFIFFSIFTSMSIQFFIVICCYHYRSLHYYNTFSPYLQIPTFTPIKDYNQEILILSWFINSMTRGGGFTLSKLLYIASLEESLLEMSSNCFKKFEGCMVMCFTYTLWKCRMVLSDYFQFTRSFFSTHWSFYAYANCLTNTWLLFSITILGTFINPPCWCLWRLFEYLALVIE